MPVISVTGSLRFCKSIVRPKNKKKKVRIKNAASAIVVLNMGNSAFTFLDGKNLPILVLAIKWVLFTNNPKKNTSSKDEK